MIELDNLKKALEADSWCQECGQEHIRPAIEQLIKALEQPTQEPVAMYEKGNVNWINTPKDNSPLYTHPKEWQGLSDDEISKVISDEQIPVRTGKTANRFARAIEAKLKEKNT